VPTATTAGTRRLAANVPSTSTDSVASVKVASVKVASVKVASVKVVTVIFDLTRRRSEARSVVPFGSGKSTGVPTCR
jgi:hypothetical protein